MSGTNAPAPEDVRRYADRIGHEVDETTLKAFAEQFATQDELLATLDEIEDRTPPDREHWEPDEDDDPLGAFLSRCDLAPTGSGVLDGLSVAVKDNIAVAGVPMTCGSPLLADYVSPEDATVVEKLREAGGRIVGKANMDEFAFGSDRSTMRFRLARNPRKETHQPGSSSSGSGVAVGSGQADVALGTDTGGSVRFPAAWSGLVGVKPTRGLVSHHGFVQFAKTLDNVGPLARTVENAARALEAIAGEDPRDQYTSGVSVGDYVEAAERGRENDASELVIGVPDELFGVDPELDELTHAALETLADDGAELRDVSIEAYEYAIPAWLAIATTEIGAYLDVNLVNYWLTDPTPYELNEALHAALKAHPEEVGDIILSNRLYAEHLGDRYGDRYYARAQRARKLLTDGVDDALADVDVLASTTVPMLAPSWDETIEDIFGAVSNTAPFNLTGHPAISVPSGERDGLPVGIQFVGRHFDEEAVFRAAARWEALRDE